MEKAKADALFEVSYEVCNKVGGIYTVLTSKAAQMKKKYKRYITIGPYYHDKANVSIEQKPVPEEFQKAFDELKKDTADHMEKALRVLKDEYARVRTGRASTALLDTIKDIT